MIVQADKYNAEPPSVTVCLLTSHLADSRLRVRIDPAPGNGLSKHSHVMIDKAMSLPLDRLDNRIGAVTAARHAVAEIARQFRPDVTDWQPLLREVLERGGHHEAVRAEEAAPEHHARAREAEREVVKDAIRAAGARLWFLPPYSPDLNPIEQAFAKLKAALRKAQARTIDTVVREVARTLPSFSAAECGNYFRHAGYALI